MNFEPKGLAAEIQTRIPSFEISYNPDFRQDIAATWPRSIDDSPARTRLGVEREIRLKCVSGPICSKTLKVKYSYASYYLGLLVSIDFI